MNKRGATAYDDVVDAIYLLTRSITGAISRDRARCREAKTARSELRPKPMSLINLFFKAIFLVPAEALPELVSCGSDTKCQTLFFCRNYERVILRCRTALPGCVAYL